MAVVSDATTRGRLDWSLVREPAARQEFVGGIRGMLPLVMGVAPFGFLFGVLSLTAGLPWWATLAMSVLVFAGSSQFVAILLLKAATSYPFVVLTTLVLNLRHSLYAASVAEYLRPLSERWRSVLAFGMTDESFAIAITHYRKADEGHADYKHLYFLGVNLGIYATWITTSTAGYFLGNAFGDPMALGLDFALPVTFIAILVPQLRSRSVVASALIAGAVSVLTLAIPNKLGLIVAIAAGILAGMVVEKWNSRS